MLEIKEFEEHKLFLSKGPLRASTNPSDRIKEATEEALERRVWGATRKFQAAEKLTRSSPPIYWIKIWPIKKSMLLKRAKPPQNGEGLWPKGFRALAVGKLQPLLGQQMSKARYIHWPTNKFSQKTRRRKQRPRRNDCSRFETQTLLVGLLRYTKFSCWKTLLHQTRSRNTSTKWACWRILMLVETKGSSGPSIGLINFWQVMRCENCTKNVCLTRQRKLWTTKTDF